MRSRGRLAGAVLAVAIVGGLLPVGSTAAVAREGGPGPTAPATEPAAPSGRTVTLVTGDKVRLGERAGRLEPAGIEPGPGRAEVVFATGRVDGRLTVTPSDALPLLRAGQVDPRLFDIDALVEFGYDDGRPDLPLIVAGDAAGAKTRVGALTGASSVRALPGAAAVRLAKGNLGEVWRSLSGGVRTRGSGVSTIWLDGLRRPLLTASVPQIGAPAAWAAGYTGAGVTVAVVDSGVDAGHPDLAGQVVAARNYVDDDDPRDLTGHGTHVAATAAGSGAAPGGYRGVAPGARLVSARVCRPNGCPESAILAGMQWAAEQGAKVINVSLGSADTPGLDPIEQAVERITAERGALFVIAAGNDGESGEGTVASPGTAESALTVGAVNKADELADFSSRGPRDDAAIKPDLTAPGVDIVAAEGNDSAGNDPDAAHVAMSGTSMAAPHVAGAAAVLAQRYPDWSPARLKAALTGSAVTGADIGVDAQGAGRVDLARAVRQQVVAEPVGISVRDTWPLEPAPVQRTVTYRNSGAAPVELTLDVRTEAPAGMFTVADRTLTVPAGGAATTRLVIDTAVAGAGPRRGGHLVATGGDVRVTTAFAASVESEETYELALTHLGRDGAPTADVTTYVVQPERGTLVQVSTAQARPRLPKGRYVVMTVILSANGNTVLVQPDVRVDRDTALTLDARTARPTAVRVPQPDPALLTATVGTIVSGADGAIVGLTASSTELGRLHLGPVGGAARNPAVHSYFTAVFGRRGVPPEESPWTTDVALREPGRMFPGLDRTISQGELAAVETENAWHQQPLARLQQTAVWPDTGYALTSFLPVRLPSARVEFHTTEGGVRRQTFLQEWDGSGVFGNALSSPVRVFTAGRQYRERRNAGVYGPGFSDPPLTDDRWITRSGDLMRVQATLLNDHLNWAGFPVHLRRPLITLDRDGTRILERSANGVQIEVPPAAATYRLVMDLTRDAQQALSTRVTCEWTFSSGTTPEEGWTRLPLSVVRFHPGLDQRNTAPAGVPYVVPVEVQRQPGSAAAATRNLAVEVSYDDGRTWLEAPMRRYGVQDLAHVTHPAGPGFVSLRASATDTAGNTVRQTIVRAYRIG